MCKTLNLQTTGERLFKKEELVKKSLQGILASGQKDISTGPC